MTADAPNLDRIAALRANIAARQEGIAALPEGSPARPLFEADVARLCAELAALEAGDAPAEKPSLHIDQSGQQGGNSAGAGNTFGDHAHIGAVLAQHNYYGAEAADVAPLLSAYLAELAGACSRLSLADVDSVDPNKAALDLQAVYVGLEVLRQVDLPPEDPQRLRERALKAITDEGFTLEDFVIWYGGTSEQAVEAVMEQLSPRERRRRLRATEILAEHPRLVITGDPGSGKSSFVNFVSLCLARAWVGERAWLDRLGEDWPHGPLLPIRVVLREFAAWLAARSAPLPDDPGLLWQWMEQGAGQPRLLVQYLRAAFANGQALLMLDGLDEVPADAAGRPLRQLLAMMNTLASGGRRCVVTCRVLDYQRPERRLPDWPTEQIAPLSPTLRDQLIERWFTALEQLKRPTRGRPADLRDGLKRALQGRPELRRLADNPLLLTMMARLQAHDGELPGERVELYRRSVDLLLLQWRRDALGRVSLGERLALPQWGDSKLNQLLDRLAYVAHDRGVSGDSEQGADLPRQLLLDTAALFFAPYGPDQDLSRAQSFLNYISTHGNGIIQQHDQQVYRFPHRTFQEYLAGRRLISDEGWPADEPEFVDRALRVSARGPQWREAILLAVSQYAINGQIRPAVNLADELLKRHRHMGNGSDILLAADIALEVGRERIAARSPELWDRLRVETRAIMQTRKPDGSAHHPVATRVRAGFLLGDLGDERMPATSGQWQGALAQLPGDEGDAYFCRIPAGDYRIGSNADDPDARAEEQPQHTVTHPQDYWIARYPITNAQWAAWIAEGGTASRYADDEDLNHPNQPVVGIDWHAANAFCAWLTTQLQHALPQGYVLRLPSEAEWEAAARGPAARRYPWGDSWQDDCAATAVDQDKRGWSWTIPVGCYPVGAAACGALDLAGNVWEWTLSPWRSYPGAKKSFTHDNLVVVRGGGYNMDKTFVLCGARLQSLPDWVDPIGVRVVVAPPLAQMS